MSENKIVAASIVNFLRQQLEGNELNNVSRESMEVGVQCIQTAFELSPEELTQGIDLLQLVRQQLSGANVSEAERLNNEGNELMKAEKYQEALEKYTNALHLDSRNAVYFCNRAAAYLKLDQSAHAMANSLAALALNPNYGKAHYRLGLAMTGMDNHRDARISFVRAVRLEPDNELYKKKLRLAEEKLAEIRRSRRQRKTLSGVLTRLWLLEPIAEIPSDPDTPN